MQTDWLLVRRLAAELDERLRGGRISAVGLLPDGRFAADVRGGRAGRARLVVDAFAATPLVWLAGDALAALDLRATPGWSRAVADALEGRRIEGVRGRTGDRLVAIDARARSRFGVDRDVRLVLELVPKFGNLVLLKDQTIVAAAREFEPTGGRAGRTTVAGGAYEPPPLPASQPDEAADRMAFAAYAEAATSTREMPAAVRSPAVLRALRRERPLLTPLVAGSIVASVTAAAWPSGEALRAGLVTRADRVMTAIDDAREIDVYRRSGGADDAAAGALAHAHLLPLVQFDADPGFVHSRVPELSPLIAELAERAVAPAAKDSFERRRTQLATRLERRRGAVRELLERASRDRDDDGEADRLRLAGEALFTHHATIAPGATSFAPPQSEAPPIDLDPALDARANANAIFKRYRKLVNRRTHAERRLGELGAEAERLDDVAWELGRAEPETLSELARTIEALVPSGAARESTSTAAAVKRTASKRAARPASLRPHRFELGDGARLLVGRSPHGNAEVTFKLARPDDWWFHARGVPGAHVVLQIDDAREPTESEVRRAAGAAAAFSSVSATARVDVDRTRRKYVRKRDTGPGQVWYVNAQTIAVVPEAPASPAAT